MRAGGWCRWGRRDASNNRRGLVLVDLQQEREVMRGFQGKRQAAGEVEA